MKSLDGIFLVISSLEEEFRLERIFQPMGALEFIKGHVVYNLAYNYTNLGDDRDPTSFTSWTLWTS